MPVLVPPDYRERVLLVGENGSGKSTLAREMLAPGRYARYVIIDSKGDFEAVGDDAVIYDPLDKRWTGYRQRWTRTPTPDHILYKPRGPHASGRWLSYVLEQCYARAQRIGKDQPFIVYVDEALFLARTGHTAWLAALAVSGRSLGVGLWCSSQRPKWIPVEVRSEAWRWYIFALGFEEDQKEIVKYTNGQLTVRELQSSTENYEFIEIRRHPQRAGAKLVSRFPPVTITPVLTA